MRYLSSISNSNDSLTVYIKEKTKKTINMKKLLILSFVVLMAIPFLQAQEAPVKPQKPEFGKNNVSLFLSDIVLKRVSFEYEHIFGEKGNVSINVPVSVSIDEVQDIYGDYVYWWVGVGMKLYPTGQGKIRYFLGPEIRIISAKNTYTYYYDNFAMESEETYLNTAFLLNNGVIFEPAEHFIFSINLGLGFMSRGVPGGYEIEVMATPSVRMGFRF